MIQRVSVRNFKTLNDVSLPLGMLNVIVGPNMSGKTNFISVFKFLTALVRPAAGAYGLTSAVNALGGFSEIAWRGANANLISLALEGTFPRFSAAEGESTGWSYSLDFVSDGRGHLTVQEEKLTLLTPGRRYAAIRKDAKTGRRVIVGPNDSEMGQVEDANRSALEFEIPGWEGTRLRNLFSGFRFYNLIPSEMKQVNTSAVPSVLAEDGGNLSSWMLMLQTRHHNAFNQLVLAAKGILPDLASVFTYPTPQSTVFLASSERHFESSTIPIWQMSDGELCLLAWLSLIFTPPELGSLMYFIEEPENHLHPRAIDALVGLLNQQQSDLDRQDHEGVEKAQVVATTHSLTLVDRVSVDDLIVFERMNGATVCTKPSEKSHLQELLSRSDVGLGDLYYSGALGREE